jgi:divalent metal cation (Fe/Co/Zn/Cd) transporter
LRVSVASVAWTVVSGALAVVIGVRRNSTVLVAFGAVGFVDALGSLALAYHFGHGLHHERLAAHLETLAHRVVALGLCVVGAAAIALGMVRLAGGSAAVTSVEGTVVALTSVAALSFLARRKTVVAGRLGSEALRSDGHLSAVGAAEAAVTLIGSATVLLGVRWADPAAAAVVGAVALVLGASAVRLAR